MPGVTALLRISLLITSLLAAACAAPANPAALYVSHGEREVDLVLIDHEPPPY